jgi:hypothetical protein
MIKGKEKQEISAVTRYVGFTAVQVRAINPTKKEVNKLLGKEDEDDDKELVYLSSDQEGNDRLRLAFWLYDEKLDKYFVQSFNITKKERVSKLGDKNQYINSVGMTAWVDDEANLPAWFTHFLDKEKEEIGDKEFRKAYVGEEELAGIVRAWLGKISWNDPDTNVMIDVNKLFKEDYSELTSQIGGDFDTPFVVLLGVRTDENDSDKHYQQVYGKSFLPKGFMGYIEKNKFPTDYTKKVWKRFVEEVEGEYGFTNTYFELVPITEYDSTKDVAASKTANAGDVTPVNAKY